MADRITVRRRRVEHFAAVPHTVARDSTLSDKALRLWIVLQCYADWDDRDCYPSMATIAVDMGCTDRTVRRALDELVDRQLVEVESGQAAGRPNVYTVIDPPEGRTPVSGGSDTHVLPGRTPMSEGGRTPMSDKQDPGELDPTPEPTTASIEPLLGFDKFWDAYPRRNGKRVGRGKCEERWKRLDLTDRRAAYRGAVNYAAAVDRGVWLARDPERWLRDRDWVDWQVDEARPDARPGPTDPMRRQDGDSLTTLIQRATGAP